jgi:hypothetical protein
LPPVPHRLRGIIVGSLLLLALPFLANDAAAQLPADRCDACAKEKAARDEAERQYRTLFEELQSAKRNLEAALAGPRSSQDQAERDRLIKLSKLRNSTEERLREQFEEIKLLQRRWLKCLGEKCPDVRAALDLDGPQYVMPVRRKVCAPCNALADRLFSAEDRLARERLEAGILERALNNYTNKVLAGTLTRTDKEAYEAYRNQLEAVRHQIPHYEHDFYLALALLEQCVKEMCPRPAMSTPPGGAGDGETFHPIEVCPACRDLADKLAQDASTLLGAESDLYRLRGALDRYPQVRDTLGPFGERGVDYGKLSAAQKAEVDELSRQSKDAHGIIDRLSKRIPNERRELENCVKDPKCAPPKGASVVPGAGAGPTLEEMRRAQELTKGDSGQGGMYVSPSLQDPPVQRTVPIIPPGATGRPSTPTPVPPPAPTLCGRWSASATPSCSS